LLKVIYKEIRSQSISRVLSLDSHSSPTNVTICL